MSLHRFFLDDQVLSDITNDDFILDLAHEDLKHAKVIRLKPGEHIAVIDAQSDYFECRVVDLEQDGLRVAIAQHLDAPREPFSLTLFQGIAKGERFEFVLKHSTELGVSAICPLISERCVVKLDANKISSKMARWKTIVKNAAKQAGLSFIPVLHEPVSIKDVASAGKLAEKTAASSQVGIDLNSFDLVIICWEEALDCRSIRCTIKDAALIPEGRIALIVGPEGGFSDDEVSAMLASNKHAKLASLGPTILRTETAGIVSCALALDALREGNGC